MLFLNKIGRTENQPPHKLQEPWELCSLTGVYFWNLCQGLGGRHTGLNLCFLHLLLISASTTSALLF